MGFTFCVPKLRMRIMLPNYFKLVPLFVAFWRRFGNSAFACALRARSTFVAIAILLASVIANSPYLVKLYFGGVYNGWPRGVALAAMIYFALEADRSARSRG